MIKRLYRSTTDKVIGGVCGGLGEYFEIDPALFRIGAALLVLANGTGLLLYLIMMVAIKKRPLDVQLAPVEYRASRWTRYIPGSILILLGLVFLIKENWFWFDLHHVFHLYWPVLLIAVGLVLVLFHGRQARGDSSTPVSEPPVTPQNGGAIA